MAETSRRTDDALQKVLTEGRQRGEEITQINRKMDSIDRWRVRADFSINKHDHTLYGNGEIGMDEMLRKLYEWMQASKTREQEGWSDTKKFVIGTIAFVVNTLIAVGIARLLQ